MRQSLLVSAALLLPTLAAAGPVVPHYAVSGQIAGPDGGWDYARVDPVAHRLYVARTGSVTVADLGPSGKVESWGEVQRGHAALPLPGNRLLVTSGNDNSVRIFDTLTGKQTASIAVGKKPDAAIYDAAHHRAIVMNGSGGTVSLIDTQTLAVTATIAAAPGLEYAALAKDGTLFVNNEDTDSIAVIDPAKGAVMGSVALAGCKGPTGLGYDARSDRLIAACGNGKAAVVDARARRLVSLVAIGQGPDAVIVDEARRLAFVPCGRDGVLDILSLDAPGGVAKVGSVTTEPGARTGALDPTTGAIYLPSAKMGPPPAAGGRPAMIPGSFHILIVRPA